MSPELTRSLSRPDVIAFDCYRTLLANEPADWVRTFDDISREQGLRLPGADLWDAWKKEEMLFRESRLNLRSPELSPPFKPYELAWAECFATLFGKLGLRGDPVLGSRRCVEHMARRPPFPEAARALRHLSGRVKLAVLSNADEAFLKPALVQLGVRFVATVSSEAACAYKPAPAAYEALLSRLALNPSRVWYVGDHLNEDVYGSRQAGLTPIWLNRPGSEGYYAASAGMDSARNYTPDAEISDLREMESLFAGSI